MKIAAVICEFNPFHNGHKYLIDKIKSEYADIVVAIMSGNFVQRGDIAITDKYARAKVALENGCDLVVELPTTFALSSAQRFANGGVNIAKMLNADLLCFGAENSDINMLKDIAKITQHDDFNTLLKELLNSGEYYPKAICKAVEKLLGSNYALALEKPNNTLGVEYIKALKNSEISPIAISRTGTDHDSNVTTENIASATYIRSLIKSDEDYSAFTKSIIKNPSFVENIESAILYKLRTMTKEEIENLPDVSEGLHNRIFECARNSNSLEELYTNLKTKRYTLSRLRRIVMYALLNIKKKDMQSDISYIRVLGMNDNGAKLLKNATLPVVAKVKQDYEKLSVDAKEMFDIDLRASDIYSLSRKDSSDSINDFNAQLIKI